ncbi:hypothetical protein GCM10007875_21790 [Limnobacter litoralis]|uniref:Cytochrome c domain-containing protein n=1 Tax=Limnobacter litoralis TaxID=481366 RepID=A0ABQ5YVY1_9BURK|nr:hypothetical protein GCM10007875_21790 [Limnobacter litoralis]
MSIHQIRLSNQPAVLRALLLAGAILSLFATNSAQAIPVFARQTQQKCVACHAGGQFPELTPFGRLFKETGYTMGERTMPFSVMALAEYAKVASTLDAAPAWMQYVPVGSPGAYQFTDANTPYPTTASDSGVAGLTAYALWNSCVYAEFGLYRTANQIFSILNAGTPTADTTQLQGLNNPYWRLAYTKDWGSQNIMVGTSGMLADVYDGTTTPTDGNAYQHKKSIGLDMQYQYLGDPNVVSVQMAYMRNTVDDSVNGGGGPSIDTPRTFRSKLTYVYQNTYGGDVAYFNLIDEKDRTQEKQGLTYELFWIPVQDIRVGRLLSQCSFLGLFRPGQGLQGNFSFVHDALSQRGHRGHIADQTLYLADQLNTALVIAFNRGAFDGQNGRAKKCHFQGLCKPHFEHVANQTAHRATGVSGGLQGTPHGTPQ